MNYALEVLLAERQRAQQSLVEVQRRLVDLNTAIAALGTPNVEVAAPPEGTGFAEPVPRPKYHFEGAAAEVSYAVPGHPEAGGFATPEEADAAAQKLRVLAKAQRRAAAEKYDEGAELPGPVEVTNRTDEPEDVVTSDQHAQREQVHIDVAAEGPVTTAVEHDVDVTLEKPTKRTKKAKKGKASADLSSPLPRAASPFKNGDAVVVKDTGEIGEVVSSTPQAGGVMVHGVKFEDRSVKHLGAHRLEAVNMAPEQETPVMTAQENAGAAPWEEPAAEEQPVAKPKRRSNGDIARDLGVSLIDVEAWKGPGRITKADIEAFAEQQRTLEEASTDNVAPTLQEQEAADTGYYDPANEEVDPESAEVTGAKFEAPW